MIPANYILHEMFYPENYDTVSGGKMILAALSKIEMWVCPATGQAKHLYHFNDKKTSDYGYFRKRCYGF